MGVCLFVCLFVCSRTPEAVEASPYYGGTYATRGTRPQGQADAAPSVRRILTPPLKKMGVEMADTEVPVSEVAPCPDPGRQYVSWVDRGWQV